MNKRDPFEQALSAQLDKTPLDLDVQKQLHAARISALDSVGRRTTPAWAPALGICSLLLVLALVLLNRTDDSDFLALEQGDDLAIIDSEDSLEMIQELEFYVWLEQELPV